MTDPNPIWASVDDLDAQRVKQAVIDGDVQQLEAARTSQVNLSALYGDEFEGHTLLHEAAWRGHVDVVRHLLLHGVPVDIHNRDQFGDSTALFWAAQEAQVGTVRALLDAGADPTVSGPNKDMVLSAVLWHPVPTEQRHLETITLLLNRGVDVNRRVSDYGATVVCNGRSSWSESG